MVADAAQQRIRQRIENGSLPRDRTIELWHDPGSGHTCDGCGLTIAAADTMSLICADDWRAVRLHDDCFQVWNAERQSSEA
jgi:hypothetical protein